ncbi:macro domain-containing protein [Dokdonella koreensis]|uniref:Integron gene cassette protein n=1 Tax=Dokdonella koreensis DS-123 TaxID=1300342 RepID=A0A160DW93_9GAMM|nr:macro domain-containing protein [Dokdonella koreensis]ANB18461.1 Putative integron gene cassette protein [Dokdonella koreensis DS-123]
MTAFPSLRLHALDAAMADAWRAHFEDAQVVIGDILSTPVDAVVSPANSFGFMDGGIDLHYARFFGGGLQDALRQRLLDAYDGELPVGQALVLPTGHATVPYLVSAPTMRVPVTIDRTVNVYLAFRAALLAVRRHNATAAPPIRRLAAPALGAGVGAMPPARVARQMHAAYAEVVLGETAWRTSARGVLAQHAHLLQ